MKRLLAVFFAVILASSAADVWRIAPPPPASWQRDRVADLTARRKAVMERIGAKAILILYAAEPRNYAGDVDWPFRQENQFFYLTAIDQPGSTLVMIPGADEVREILFMPPSNPVQESWTGHILTVQEARQISGIQEIWDVRQLPAFLATLFPHAKEMLAAGTPKSEHGTREPTSTPAPIPLNAAATFQKTIEQVSTGEAQVYMISAGRAAEYQREIEFAQKLGKLTPPVKVQNAMQIFSRLRSVKSARELNLLQHAVDITAEAFQRAFTAAVPGTPEYEIQAQFEFTFLRRNAHWGYPCIVASGVNATTLHYESNKDRMKAGDLLLMDDAAEFDGYSVDVTRTIPVSGKFSKEQAEIYRLVWDAQQAGFRHALPGRTMSGNTDSVQSAALAVFKQGLYKLGLITDPESDQQARIWFNHGVGHGIGLNVHDALTGELQPGMVITVEPGLYFRPDALEHLPKTPDNEKFIAAVRPAFEKYKGIGVRIEDDVVITNGQPKVLSTGIPSRLEEVELSIAQLRRAMKSNPMP